MMRDAAPIGAAPGPEPPDMKSHGSTRRSPASTRRAALAWCVALALPGVALAQAAGGTAKGDAAAREARELADKLRGPSAQAEPLPKGDPCALLADADVRRHFPKASAPQRERTREKYGITACMWEHPAGRLVVQLTIADPGTVGDEVRGLVAGFVDPLMRDASKAVRIEKLAGVGADAWGVVERADAKRGILSDVAYMITERGERQLMIGAVDLARGDRAAALKALEDLGRTARGRM